MADQFRKKPEGIKDPAAFDFKLVNDPLEKIYHGILPKVEKEDCKTPTYFFIANLLKTSYQTYKVTRRLVADAEKEKFPIQAHMLSRSIIDATFIVIALLDDPDNTRKYELAGFRKFWEKYQQEKEYYKARPEMGAEAWLAEKKALLDHLVESLKITPIEAIDPKTVSRWPVPGRFFHKNSPVKLSSDRSEFLKEIYKWHYGETSSVNHLDWEGMAMTVFATMPEHHWDPGKYESDAVYTGMLFLLIMLSEVEISNGYGCKTDLQYLWTILGEYYLEVKEYYEMRYRNLLKTT